MLLPTLITSYSAFVSIPFLPFSTRTLTLLRGNTSSLVMLFWFRYIFILCAHFNVNDFLVCAPITLHTFSVLIFYLWVSHPSNLTCLYSLYIFIYLFIYIFVHTMLIFTVALKLSNKVICNQYFEYAAIHIWTF